MFKFVAVAAVTNWVGFEQNATAHDKDIFDLPNDWS